ncbi:hypothetical protein [Chitinophaga sp. CF418]|uniref:hypothetical protein n=1 Tax=Chitinophaga sp. CF418 TaxID=1855287 RepID=UPI00091454FE|nr:hypothetical protein [Chitinophaga sp. CF418]SHN38676.1 hypothetical protein SAMN05216311_11133 [Chitinophaga sp. CF418]
MKQLRFSCVLVYATMIGLLTACGGGGREKTNTDSTAMDTTPPAEVAPVTSTIVTTPQSMMVAKHKVANFDKWLTSYEGHDSMRMANGIHSYVIGRGLQDPDMVLVAVKVDDMDKAKAFSKDASLKEAMKKGGVMGAPTFNFVTMVFQDTAMSSTDLRSSTMFTVKDWDTWQKAFEEGKQNRMDNGIAVRAYGHDVDDNHKVVVVTALTDTAKAYAYWKSDMLKKRMADAGVVGEPQRFQFRVVKRY